MVVLSVLCGFVSYVVVVGDDGDVVCAGVDDTLPRLRLPLLLLHVASVVVVIVLAVVFFFVVAADVAAVVVVAAVFVFVVVVVVVVVAAVVEGIAFVEVLGGLV